MTQPARSLAVGQLEGLLAHAPHPIWAVDLSGRFAMVNRAAELVFGVREADAIGRLPLELLPSELAERMVRQERDVRERMSAVVDDFDGRHGGPLAETVVVRYPVLDGAGQLAAIGGLATDVGRERRAAFELADLRGCLRGAQRLASLGAIAGDVAHDFNNMLLAVSGYAELAQRSLAGSDADSAEAKACLAQVISAAGRAQRLVERIGRYGRTEGESRLPVSMLPLLREALDLLAVSIPRCVTVRLPRSDRDAQVRVDGTQLLQIVMNLCMNSIGAMPDGGLLSLDLAARRLTQDQPAAVGALAEGDWVVLSVTDTGLGMAEELMSHIFERNVSTRPDGRGGLGLAVVRDIVLAHDGALRVVSSPGCGSCFEVWLPAATDPIAAGLPATRS